MIVFLFVLVNIKYISSNGTVSKYFNKKIILSWTLFFYKILDKKRIRNAVIFLRLCSFFWSHVFYFKQIFMHFYHQTEI